MVVILASIPWLLPWDELKVPYLPSFHVVASIAPWIGSTIYHLFMNHNTVFTVVDLTAPGLTRFGAGTLTWQDPVHSWKAGPGEVMTEENLFIYYKSPASLYTPLGRVFVE